MSNKLIGYCLKCKQRRGMNNVERVTLKSNRLADKGTCAVCGTTVFRFTKPEQKGQSHGEYVQWRREWQQKFGRKFGDTENLPETHVAQILHFRRV